MKTKSIIATAILSTLFFAGYVSASGNTMSDQTAKPSQEAMDACANKKEKEVCDFSQHGTKTSGICEKDQSSKMFCAEKK